MIAASQNPNMRSRVVNSNMGTMNNNMMMSSCSSSSQYHNRNCQNPSVVSATNDIFEAGLAAYAGVEQFGSSGGVPTTMSDLFDGALFDDELDGTFCVASTVWIVLHLIGFMIQRQQHKFSPFCVPTPLSLSYPLRYSIHVHKLCSSDGRANTNDPSCTSSCSSTNSSDFSFKNFYRHSPCWSFGCECQQSSKSSCRTQQQPQCFCTSGTPHYYESSRHQETRT